MEFRDSKGFFPLIEYALFYCEGEIVWLPAFLWVFTAAMTFFPLLVLWFLTPPIFEREKLHQYKEKNKNAKQQVHDKTFIFRYLLLRYWTTHPLQLQICWLQFEIPELRMTCMHSVYFQMLEEKKKRTFKTCFHQPDWPRFIS